MTARLDARYHLVHALLAPGGASSAIHSVGSRRFVKALTANLYSSARAVTLAMQHTLAGPAFFRDNLDLQAVRQQIAGWTPNEKPEPDRPRGAHVEERAKRPRTLAAPAAARPDAARLPAARPAGARPHHGAAQGLPRPGRRGLPLPAGAVRARAQRHRLHRPARPRPLLQRTEALFESVADTVRRLPGQRADYAAGVRQGATAAFWRGVYPEARPPAGSAPPAVPTTSLRGQPAAAVPCRAVEVR